MTSPVLILLLAGWRADAAQLFSQCRAEAQGPTGRFYVCKGWSASIAQTGGLTLDASQREEFSRTTTHSIFAGELKEEVHELKLASRVVKILHFTPKTPQKWAFHDTTIVGLENAHERRARRRQR